MAKLRHIALIVPDPEKAAKFFEQAFDMKVAGKARRGLYVSDGTINVALLKQEGNEEVGIYHFGMWVDDLDQAEKKVVDAGGNISRADRSRPRPAQPPTRTPTMRRSTRIRSASCSTSPTPAGSAP